MRPEGGALCTETKGQQSWLNRIESLGVCLSRRNKSERVLRLAAKESNSLQD